MDGSTEDYLYRVVIVHWTDAVSRDGWDSLDDVQGEDPHQCISVGVCLRHDDDCVSIAGSWGYDGNRSAKDGTYAGVMVIPRGMIQSVYRVSDFPAKVYDV